MFKSVLKGYDAIIFDLDGTIVQDEGCWTMAIKTIFEPEILSEVPYFGERGLQLRENVELIVKKNYLRAEVNQEVFYQLIVKEFFNNFDSVELTPGFIELAENLKKSGKRLAVVTNSDKAIADEIIKRLDIGKYFEFVISAQEVELPKPSPLVYLEAVKRLGVSKSKILVFEDSVGGAFAAEIAELNRIIILDPQFSPVDFGSKTRNFIDSFEVINDNFEVDSDQYFDRIFQ
jgi:HAD superfamily hydrolase (TIGR01509 family)